MVMQVKNSQTGSSPQTIPGSLLFRRSHLFTQKMRRTVINSGLGITQRARCPADATAVSRAPLGRLFVSGLDWGAGRSLRISGCPLRFPRKLILKLRTPPMIPGNHRVYGAGFSFTPLVSARQKGLVSCDPNLFGYHFHRNLWLSLNGTLRDSENVCRCKQLYIHTCTGIQPKPTPPINPPASDSS